mgnify:CR=1 FL=1
MVQDRPLQLYLLVIVRNNSSLNARLGRLLPLSYRRCRFREQRADLINQWDVNLDFHGLHTTSRQKNRRSQWPETESAYVKKERDERN